MKRDNFILAFQVSASVAAGLCAYLYLSAKKSGAEKSGVEIS